MCFISLFRSSLDGYCSTIQGLLDEFEVDLGFINSVLYFSFSLCHSGLLYLVAASHAHVHVAWGRCAGKPRFVALNGNVERMIDNPAHPIVAVDAELAAQQ